jgi:DNA-binding NarL/FixJ family response regulator
MISILLVDDHRIVREGVRNLILEMTPWRVVGETGSGVEAVEMARNLSPEVIIVDLTLPDLSGLEVIRQVRSFRESAALVVLSMHDDDRYVIEAFRAGAMAYVIKDDSAEDLVLAVKTAVTGRRFVSSSIPVRVLDKIRDPSYSVSSSEIDVLSDRERVILALVASGYTSPQIADILSISARTADSHRAHIIAKLGASNFVDLVHVAIRHGIVSVGPHRRMVS